MEGMSGTIIIILRSMDDICLRGRATRNTSTSASRDTFYRNTSNNTDEDPHKNTRFLGEGRLKVSMILSKIRVLIMLRVHLEKRFHLFLPILMDLSCL
ncbi:uncharacterized protein FOMMEDRAFT_22388 [Fomitiporia mediterranea MF3/22]|uniref:uncharacterized protein n=1 Tax=Fomitiporia mediterranea (strain MF3/22) TaxID=694068 RepID=UPI0004408678|nr:uncharacterized protein FOMMEDRAFT_22388 [Fomitiporia mediterranea MF3/22]EJD00638.1 hypothetical protein FOMMEDRAFT_22388 [Fomitiporia mediterranea MF3/22]